MTIEEQWTCYRDNRGCDYRIHLDTADLRRDEHEQGKQVKHLADAIESNSVHSEQP